MMIVIEYTENKRNLALLKASWDGSNEDILHKIIMLEGEIARFDEEEREREKQRQEQQERDERNWVEPVGKWVYDEATDCLELVEEEEEEEEEEKIPLECPVVIPLERKTCIKCGLEKTLQDFHRDKSMKDGIENTCSWCKNAFTGISKKIKRDFPPEVQTVEYHKAIDAHVNEIRVNNSLPIIERKVVDADGKVSCRCGARVLSKVMTAHLKTFKHKAFLQSQT